MYHLFFPVRPKVFSLQSAHCYGKQLPIPPISTPLLTRSALNYSRSLIWSGTAEAEP